MKKIILNIILILTVSALNAQTREKWFFELITNESAKNTNIANIINKHSSDIAKNYNLAVALADHFYKIKDYQSFEKVIEIADNRGDILYYKALYRAMNGDSESSLEYLSEHLKSANRKLRGEIRSNSAFDNIRDKNEWNEFWRIKHYRKRDIEFEAAINYFKDKEYQWAIEELNKLINKYPSDAEYYFLKSKTLYKSGRLNEAVNYIEKTTEINSRKDNFNVLLFRQKNQNLVPEMILRPTSCLKSKTPGSAIRKKSG